MKTCKFQTNHDGTKVLVYSKDRSIFAESDDPAFVSTICAAVGMTGPIQRRYAKARISDEGQIEIGRPTQDPGW